jgi:exopolysaccharide biosynthesis protein
VRDGAVVFDPDDDREGFSAGAGQFDSDITDGRHPRAALGLGAEHLLAVACDGRRSRVDDGLTMGELAEVMLELGAESAINLDGGGSTTLVHRRHLLNRPYSTQDQPAPESRPIVTALLLVPRDGPPD